MRIILIKCIHYAWTEREESDKLTLVSKTNFANESFNFTSEKREIDWDILMSLSPVQIGAKL